MIANMISRRVWVVVVLTASCMFCLLAFAQTPERPTTLIHYLPSAKPVRLDRERIQTFVAKQAAPLSEEEAGRLGERVFSEARARLVRQDAFGEKPTGRLLFHDPKDASATFDINLQTRDILFNRGLAAYKREEETAHLPGAEEAARAATAHLEKLEMLPPREELVLAHVGGINLGVHREDGTTDLYRKLVVVRYDRTLAGLPVLGRSRLVLRLGEGGNLTGLIRRWTPVEGRRVRPDELLPDDTIERGIRERLLTEGRGATRIVVKNTDLVLYDHGGGVIEPAIHVVANLHYEVKVVNSRIVGEVRRLDVPFDTFVPVLKSYKATYPFMHNPEATRRVAIDQPVQLREREYPVSEGESERPPN